MPISKKLLETLSSKKETALLGGGAEKQQKRRDRGLMTARVAARVSQNEGTRVDPSNFLLMHTMGPNVAGVIGTAVVAGYFIARLGG